MNEGQDNVNTIALPFKQRWKVGALPNSVSVSKRVDCRYLMALGSCFARNLRRWLAADAGSMAQHPWDVLFNPFAIHLELQRLLGSPPWPPQPIDLSGTNPGSRLYRDPWRDNFASSVAALREYNVVFDVQARKVIGDASGFLFTFGLTEVWCQIDNPKLILNRAPLDQDGQLAAGWTHRFASVAETVECMTALVALIRSRVSEELPIILSVSPIPLKFTASDRDVREANNLSKATLLLSVNEVANRSSNVFYFNSFEIIQALGETGLQVWQSDGRHVTAAAVDTVARRFVALYHDDKLLSRPPTSFWVPAVDSDGHRIGRLFVDGHTELTPSFD